jgi:hypothetical protein
MSPDVRPRPPSDSPHGPDAIRDLRLSMPLRLDLGEVARLAHCDLGRWRQEIGDRAAEGLALADPRARWVPVEREALAGLFAGGTPVEEIASRGTAWAFVATVGGGLEARVGAYFAQGRYLEAVVLDAVGSVAVEAVAAMVQQDCAGEAPSARFSPGYCLWRLANQRALFDLLRPERIGIRLMPSMIMRPLKSVSGVVVRAARGEDLLVAPEDCAPCESVGCTRHGAMSGEVRLP